MMPIFLVEVIFSDESFRFIEKTYEAAKHRLLICLGEKLDQDLIEELGEHCREGDLDFYCSDHSDGLFDSFGVYEITTDLQIVSKEF
jgi:hypothetical protein